MSRVKVNRVENRAGTIGVNVDEMVQSVKVLDGIKKLEPKPNVIQTVKGFYAGSDVGGGQFYYDPARSKTDHNGGTVIAPEALTAWNGTHAGLSVLLNWTGTGIGCYVRLFTDLCPEYFGAKMDGISPDYLPTQVASNLKLNLLIKFPLFLESSVTVYSNVTFKDAGCLIHTNQTHPLFIFKNSTAPIIVNSSALTGLTRYSKKISGIDVPVEKGGFLYLDSEEVLINRRTGGFYKKQEVVSLANSLGDLAVSVYENYSDLSSLSVQYFVPEDLLIINNLKIFCNNTEVNVDGLITVENRSVIINNLHIKNCANIGAQLKLDKCTSVINSPTITGSDIGSLGYGIVIYRSISTKVNSPTILNCRHGIAARHDKFTNICGGVIHKIIDSHYGYEMTISDVSLTGDISFAGENIYVNNITQYSPNAGISQRNDAPEIRGCVTYTNNTIYLTESSLFFASVKLGSASAFNYGRTLINPEKLCIMNNSFNYVSGNQDVRQLWFINPNSHTYTAVKKIKICDNIFKGFSSKYKRHISDLTIGDNVLSDDNIEIEVSNEDYVNLHVIDNRSVKDGSGWKVKFSIKDINTLTLSVDKTAFVDSKIVDCNITNIQDVSLGLTNSYGTWFMTRCNLRNIVNNEHLEYIVGKIFLELLPNNTALKFKIPEKHRSGTYQVIRQSDNGRSGLFLFESSNDNYSRLVPCGIGDFMENINNTSLSGTTGPLNKVSVSCNDGYLWLENRSGGPSNFYVNINVF